ncbi:MAG: transposase [Bacteroidota bacterium]
MVFLLKDSLEQSLETEMEEHLNETQRVAGNKRNGKGAKSIKSGLGTFSIQTPQERQSTLDPTIVRKPKSILAGMLEEKIIGLYRIGMSYRDISLRISKHNVR